MKKNLCGKITKMCAGVLLGLVIGHLPAVGEQTAATPGGQEKAIADLAAKAQAVETALNDMRAGLKVAAGLQAAAGREAGRKSQAEAESKALQEARQAAGRRLDDLRLRLADAEKELIALEKQKAKLEEQLKKQVEQSAVAAERQKEAENLRAELARDKQAQAEIEDRIVEAERARSVAAQAITDLKKRLIAGEDQIRALKKQAEAQAHVRSELAEIRGINAEKGRGINELIAARAEIEKASAVYKDKLAAMQASITLLAEQSAALEQAQADIEKEDKARSAIEKQLSKGQSALEAAGKEKDRLQARLAERQKEIEAGAERQKALNELKASLEQFRQARGAVGAQLADTEAKQAAARKETVELKRKLGEMEDRLERQSKQARELKNLQSDLAREQKAREEKESELKKKEQAFAVTEKEHNELKQTLAEIEKKYAAGQAQIKAIAQARSDLERERELLKQAGKRAGETTSREKALARQNRGLKDQLQTVGKKNAALAEEQERQSQSIAELAAENKPERSAPESVVEAEKKIIAQAKGETAPESGQPPQDAEKAKPPVFRSARAEADWHYQTGIRKWDAGDVDGAIAEFRKTVGIDGSLAGAYYNIALGYARKDDRDRACDYAYKAGEVYLENKNFKQATRMVVLIKNIDPSSSLIEKLRKQIAKKQ